MKKGTILMIMTFVLLVFASAASSQSALTSSGARIERVNISESETALLKSVNSTESKSFELNSDDPRAVITVLPNNGGTSQNSRAPQSNFRYQRCYYFISAAEMTASGFPAGQITSIGFNYSAASTATGNFRVLFENAAAFADKGTNWNVAISAMTQVHSGTITLPATAGTVDFALNNSGAFSYSGGGLWVAWEYSNPGGTLPGTFNTALCNTSLPAPHLRNSQANDSLRVIQTSSTSFRPETRLGNLQNDIITVGPVYSLGEAAACPCPDTNLIRVNLNHLENTLDTIILKTTVKNVTGGNIKYEWEDTLVVSTISRWIFSYVYPKDGDTKKLDSIISVGRVLRTEDITSNNRARTIKRTTLFRWNHAEPTGALSGGVGFTGAAGDFVAQFYAPCAIPITAVHLSFFAATGGGNQPFNVKILANDNDSLIPGAVIYTSGALTSPPGVTGSAQRTVHKLSTPVTVGPGYYYVGVSQTGTTNLAYGYQAENPVRPGNFFFASPVGSLAWVDFAAGGANFKLDIAPKTYTTMDLGYYLEGFISGSSMISDTVKVIAHSLATGAGLDTAKSVVLNGSGFGRASFPCLSNDSCVVFQIKHRNHVRIWSPLVCNKIDACDYIYNFRSAATQTYQSNVVFMPGVGGFASYAGDVNQDDFVDVTDVALIDNDVSNFVSGPGLVTDVTGDQTVDVSDLAATDNNAFNFVSAFNPFP